MHFITWMSTLAKLTMAGAIQSWAAPAETGSIRSLTPELADELATREHDLDLDRVTSITAEVARALAKHVGCRLSLSGLTTLPDNVAAALSRYDGNLYLDGLVSLSSGAAKALAKHKGGILSLDGLTDLSEMEAEAFAKHRGTLRLGSLTALSDPQAQSLSNHKGQVVFSRLSAVSDKGRALLRTNPGIALPQHLRP